MDACRKRRTVRCASRVVAVIVLLPVAYLASAVSVQFAAMAGWMPPSLFSVVMVVYQPLVQYLEQGYPGTDFLMMVLNWANEAGEQVRR